MGLRDLLTNTIYRMDLLSSTPCFRTRKEPSYETMIGGILSFFLMGLFGYFLYLQMSSMFDKLSITYTSGLEDNVQSTSSFTSFPFALSIDGVNLAQTPRKFIIELKQNTLTKVNGTPTFVKTNIPLSQCNVSDWTGYGSSFAGQLSTFGFTDMLCITKGSSVVLSGYAGSSNYNFLSLQISQCNQTLDASCDSTSNINTYMTNYLNLNDYFNVRFFVLDTIVTPTNDNAIVNVLQKNIFMAFSNTIGTVGYLNMAQYQLITDTNLLPVNSYESETGSYIEKFVSNAVSLSTTRYVKFNIYKSTKDLTISRTIGKIDTVLSYVGGLFSLLFTAVAFFLGSYSQYKYELYVAESMMTDDDGKRVGSENLTFLNYFFYCCYDWMDTFGIAPTCFTSLKSIHEMRQQACEQLDPGLILKRIKHLENISKLLISQHRQMCLYLSEPFTLQQARRMRTTLAYYDEMLNEVNQQEMVSSRNTEEQKFLDFGKRNAIRNEDEIDSVNPLRKQKQPQLSEEEEKKLLETLMYQSLEKLEEDNSEMGKKIKSGISARMKEWIMKNKKFNTQDLFEGQNNQLELASPPHYSKNEESVARLKVKEDKNRHRISIKKAKR